MTTSIIPDLPDSEVKVKISTCQACGGIVRVAVAHYLTADTKARNEFRNEVMQHNLAVKTQALPEYRKEKQKWCSCNDHKQKQ